MMEYKEQMKLYNEILEIAIDQIRTISTQRLLKKIDKLSTQKASELRLLISEMYGE